MSKHCSAARIINRTFRIYSQRIMASAIAVVFMYSTISTPFAEASFWKERRQAVERQRAKGKGQSENLTFAQLPNSANLNQLLPNIGADQSLLNSSLDAFRKNIKGLSLNEQKAKINKLPTWLTSLPSMYGDVRNIYIAPSSPLVTPGHPSSPFVILIQDIHEVYSAQKNISQMLTHIDAGTKGPLLVGVEGTTGAFNINPYRQHTNIGHHKAISDYFLKQGYIHGGEHFAFLAQEEPVLWGMEEPNLYIRNVEAYKQSIPLKAQLKEYIKETNQALGPVKNKVFSKSLQKLEQNLAGFHNQTVSLSDYVRFLSKGQRAKSKGKNIKNFIRALNIEESLDFKVVERERTRLINVLAKKLSTPDLQSLLQASMAYRAGQVTYGAYYDYLRALSEKSGVPLKGYKSFDRYIQYVLMAEKIDSEKLFHEVEVLKKHVVNILAKTQPQKELCQISEDLRLLDKLSKHEFGPNEWKLYQSRKEQIASLDEGVNKTIDQRPKTEDLNAKSLPDLKAFERFYETAEARNKTIVDNLIKKSETKLNNQFPISNFQFPITTIKKIYDKAGLMEFDVDLTDRPADLPDVNMTLMMVKTDSESKESHTKALSRMKHHFRNKGSPVIDMKQIVLEDQRQKTTDHRPQTKAKSSGQFPSISVLIAGGFHTPGIQKMLEAKQISYATLTPKLAEIPEGAQYLDVFTRDNTPLEKLLLGEKLFVKNTSATSLGPDAPGAQPLYMKPVLDKTMAYIGAGETRPGQVYSLGTAQASQNLLDYLRQKISSSRGQAIVLAGMGAVLAYIALQSFFDIDLLANWTNIDLSFVASAADAQVPKYVTAGFTTLGTFMVIGLIAFVLSAIMWLFYKPSKKAPTGRRLFIKTGALGAVALAGASCMGFGSEFIVPDFSQPYRFAGEDDFTDDPEAFADAYVVGETEDISVYPNVFNRNYWRISAFDGINTGIMDEDFRTPVLGQEQRNLANQEVKITLTDIQQQYIQSSASVQIWAESINPLTGEKVRQMGPSTVLSSANTAQGTLTLLYQPIADAQGFDPANVQRIGLAMGSNAELEIGAIKIQEAKIQAIGAQDTGPEIIEKRTRFPSGMQTPGTYFDPDANKQRERYSRQDLLIALEQKQIDDGPISLKLSPKYISQPEFILEEINFNEFVYMAQEVQEFNALGDEWELPDGLNLNDARIEKLKDLMKLASYLSGYAQFGSSAQIVEKLNALITSGRDLCQEWARWNDLPSRTNKEFETNEQKRFGHNRALLQKDILEISELLKKPDAQNALMPYGYTMTLKVTVNGDNVGQHEFRAWQGHTFELPVASLKKRVNDESEIIIEAVLPPGQTQAEHDLNLNWEEVVIYQKGAESSVAQAAAGLMTSVNPLKAASFLSPLAPVMGLGLVLNAWRNRQERVGKASVQEQRPTAQKEAKDARYAKRFQIKWSLGRFLKEHMFLSIALLMVSISYAADLIFPEAGALVRESLGPWLLPSTDKVSSAGLLGRFMGETGISSYVITGLIGLGLLGSVIAPSADSEATQPEADAQTATPKSTTAQAKDPTEKPLKVVRKLTPQERKAIKQRVAARQQKAKEWYTAKKKPQQKQAAPQTTPTATAKQKEKLVDLTDGRLGTITPVSGAELAAKTSVKEADKPAKEPRPVKASVGDIFSFGAKAVDLVFSKAGLFFVGVPVLFYYLSSQMNPISSFSVAAPLGSMEQFGIIFILAALSAAVYLSMKTSVQKRAADRKIQMKQTYLDTKLRNILFTVVGVAVFMSVLYYSVSPAEVDVANTTGALLSLGIIFGLFGATALLLKIFGTKFRQLKKRLGEDTLLDKIRRSRFALNVRFTLIKAFLATALAACTNLIKDETGEERESVDLSEERVGGRNDESAADITGTERFIDLAIVSIDQTPSKIRYITNVNENKSDAMFGYDIYLGQQEFDDIQNEQKNFMAFIDLAYNGNGVQDPDGALQVQMTIKDREGTVHHQEARFLGKFIEQNGYFSIPWESLQKGSNTIEFEVIGATGVTTEGTIDQIKLGLAEDILPQAADQINLEQGFALENDYYTEEEAEQKNAQIDAEGNKEDYVEPGESSVFETAYETDDKGNFLVDENGQYIKRSTFRMWNIDNNTNTEQGLKQAPAWVSVEGLADPEEGQDIDTDTEDDEPVSPRAVIPLSINEDLALLAAGSVKIKVEAYNVNTGIKRIDKDPNLMDKYFKQGPPGLWMALEYFDGVNWVILTDAMGRPVQKLIQAGAADADAQTFEIQGGVLAKIANPLPQLRLRVMRSENIGEAENANTLGAMLLKKISFSAVFDESQVQSMQLADIEKWGQMPLNPIDQTDDAEINKEQPWYVYTVGDPDMEMVSILERPDLEKIVDGERVSPMGRLMLRMKAALDLVQAFNSGKMAFKIPVINQQGEGALKVDVWVHARVVGADGQKKWKAFKLGTVNTGKGYRGVFIMDPSDAIDPDNPDFDFQFPQDEMFVLRFDAQTGGADSVSYDFEKDELTPNGKRKGKIGFYKAEDLALPQITDLGEGVFFDLTGEGEDFPVSMITVRPTGTKIAQAMTSYDFGGDWDGDGEPDDDNFEPYTQMDFEMNISHSVSEDIWLGMPVIEQRGTGPMWMELWVTVDGTSEYLGDFPVGAYFPSRINLSGLLPVNQDFGFSVRVKNIPGQPKFVKFWENKVGFFSGYSSLANAPALADVPVMLQLTEEGDKFVPLSMLTERMNEMLPTAEFDGDFDENGIPDFLEVDENNDGIPDVLQDNDPDNDVFVPISKVGLLMAVTQGFKNTHDKLVVNLPVGEQDGLSPMHLKVSLHKADGTMVELDDIFVGKYYPGVLSVDTNLLSANEDFVIKLETVSYEGGPKYIKWEKLIDSSTNEQKNRIGIYAEGSQHVQAPVITSLPADGLKFPLADKDTPEHLIDTVLTVNATETGLAERKLYNTLEATDFVWPGQQDYKAKDALGYRTSFGEEMAGKTVALFLDEVRQGVTGEEDELTDHSLFMNTELFINKKDGTSTPLGGMSLGTGLGSAPFFVVGTDVPVGEDFVLMIKYKDGTAKYVSFGEKIGFYLIDDGHVDPTVVPEIESVPAVFGVALPEDEASEPWESNWQRVVTVGTEEQMTALKQKFPAGLTPQNSIGDFDEDGITDNADFAPNPDVFLNGKVSQSVSQQELALNLPLARQPYSETMDTMDIQVKVFQYVNNTPVETSSTQQTLSLYYPNTFIDLTGLLPANERFSIYIEVLNGPDFMLFQRDEIGLYTRSAAEVVAPLTTIGTPEPDDTQAELVAKRLTFWTTAQLDPENVKYEAKVRPARTEITPDGVVGHHSLMPATLETRTFDGNYPGVDTPLPEGWKPHTRTVLDIRMDQSSVDKTLALYLPVIKQQQDTQPMKINLYMNRIVNGQSHSTLLEPMDETGTPMSQLEIGTDRAGIFYFNPGTFPSNEEFSLVIESVDEAGRAKVVVFYKGYAFLSDARDPEVMPAGALDRVPHFLRRTLPGQDFKSVVRFNQAFAQSITSGFFNGEWTPGQIQPNFEPFTQVTLTGEISSAIDGLTSGQTLYLNLPAFEQLGDGYMELDIVAHYSDDTETNFTESGPVRVGTFSPESYIALEGIKRDIGVSLTITVRDPATQEEAVLYVKWDEEIGFVAGNSSQILTPATILPETADDAFVDLPVMQAPAPGEDPNEFYPVATPARSDWPADFKNKQEIPNALNRPDFNGDYENGQPVPSDFKPHTETGAKLFFADNPALEGTKTVLKLGVNGQATDASTMKVDFVLHKKGMDPVILHENVDIGLGLDNIFEFDLGATGLPLGETFVLRVQAKSGAGFITIENFRFYHPDHPDVEPTILSGIMLPHRAETTADGEDYPTHAVIGRMNGVDDLVPAGLSNEQPMRIVTQMNESADLSNGVYFHMAAVDQTGDGYMTADVFVDYYDGQDSVHVGEIQLGLTKPKAFVDLTSAVTSANGNMFTLRVQYKSGDVTHVKWDAGPFGFFVDNATPIQTPQVPLAQLPTATDSAPLLMPMVQDPPAGTQFQPVSSPMWTEWHPVLENQIQTAGLNFVCDSEFDGTGLSTDPDFEPVEQIGWRYAFPSNYSVSGGQLAFNVPVQKMTGLSANLFVNVYDETGAAVAQKPVTVEKYKDGVVLLDVGTEIPLGEEFFVMIAYDSTGPKGFVSLDPSRTGFYHPDHQDIHPGDATPIVLPAKFNVSEEGQDFSERVNLGVPGRDIVPSHLTWNQPVVYVEGEDPKDPFSRVFIKAELDASVTDTDIAERGIWLNLPALEESGITDDYMNIDVFVESEDGSVSVPAGTHRVGSYFPAAADLTAGIQQIGRGFVIRMEYHTGTTTDVQFVKWWEGNFGLFYGDNHQISTPELSAAASGNPILFTLTAEGDDYYKVYSPAGTELENNKLANALGNWTDDGTPVEFLDEGIRLHVPDDITDLDDQMLYLPVGAQVGYGKAQIDVHIYTRDNQTSSPAQTLYVSKYRAGIVDLADILAGYEGQEVIIKLQMVVSSTIGNVSKIEWKMDTDNQKGIGIYHRSDPIIQDDIATIPSLTPGTLLELTENNEDFRELTILTRHKVNAGITRTGTVDWGDGQGLVQGSPEMHLMTRLTSNGASQDGVWLNLAGGEDGGTDWYMNLDIKIERFDGTSIADVDTLRAGTHYPGAVELTPYLPPVGEEFIIHITYNESATTNLQYLKWWEGEFGIFYGNDARIRTPYTRLNSSTPVQLIPLSGEGEAFSPVGTPERTGRPTAKSLTKSTFNGWGTPFYRSGTRVRFNPADTGQAAALYLSALSQPDDNALPMRVRVRAFQKNADPINIGETLVGKFFREPLTFSITSAMANQELTFVVEALSGANWVTWDASEIGFYIQTHSNVRPENPLTSAQLEAGYNITNFSNAAFNDYYLIGSGDPHAESIGETYTTQIDNLPLTASDASNDVYMSITALETDEGQNANFSVFVVNQSGNEINIGSYDIATDQTVTVTLPSQRLSSGNNYIGIRYNSGASHPDVHGISFAEIGFSSEEPVDLTVTPDHHRVGYPDASNAEFTGSKNTLAIGPETVRPGEPAIDRVYNYSNAYLPSATESFFDRKLTAGQQSTGFRWFLQPSQVLGGAGSLELWIKTGPGVDDWAQIGATKSIDMSGAWIDVAPADLTGAEKEYFKIVCTPGSPPFGNIGIDYMDFSPHGEAYDEAEDPYYPAIMPLFLLPYLLGISIPAVVTGIAAFAGILFILYKTNPTAKKYIQKAASWVKAHTIDVVKSIVFPEPDTKWVQDIIKSMYLNMVKLVQPDVVKDVDFEEPAASEVIAVSLRMADKEFQSSPVIGNVLAKVGVRNSHAHRQSVVPVLYGAFDTGALSGKLFGNKEVLGIEAILTRELETRLKAKQSTEAKQAIEGMYNIGRAAAQRSLETDQDLMFFDTCGTTAQGLSLNELDLKSIAERLNSRTGNAAVVITEEGDKTALTTALQKHAGTLGTDAPLSGAQHAQTILDHIDQVAVLKTSAVMENNAISVSRAQTLAVKAKQDWSLLKACVLTNSVDEASALWDVSGLDWVRIIINVTPEVTAVLDQDDLRQMMDHITHIRQMA